MHSEMYANVTPGPLRRRSGKSRAHKPKPKVDLTRMYYQGDGMGDGVPQDKRRAAELYQAAAEQGGGARCLC